MGWSWHPSQSTILSVLLDREPRSAISIASLTGLGLKAVQEALTRCWRNSYVLRTDSMNTERRDIFHGRKELDKALRYYHLYLVPEEPTEMVQIGNRRFVKFDPARHVRKNCGNRAKLVLETRLSCPYWTKLVAKRHAGKIHPASNILIQSVVGMTLEITPTAIASVLYLGVFGSPLAFAGWYRLFTKTAPTNT